MSQPILHRETNDVSRTTASEDGLFAHPADCSDTETVHELIIAYTQQSSFSAA